MGILDGVVEWISEQIMHGLDLINTSVLGALGCGMETFLRYFPAAETMYDIFTAIGIGLDVGHTGGSMHSEAMIAMRAIGTATSAVGSTLGRHSRHGSVPTSGKSGAGSAAAAGFFSGGLVWTANRKVASDAVRTATTVKKSSKRSSAKQLSIERTQAVTPSPVRRQLPSSSEPAARAAPIPAAPMQFRSFGGTLFANSLYQGGTFANDVIGTVTKDDFRTTGSITSETATRSLLSYMGLVALGDRAPQHSALPGCRDRRRAHHRTRVCIRASGRN